MPEGDAVMRSCRRLHAALAGQQLVAAELRVPRHATADLTGRTVLEVVSYGKHQLTRLSDGLTLHTHLRMDGTWRLIEPGGRWPRPAHQLRVRLVTDRVEAVGFLLGEVDLVRTADEDRLIGHLGPDLLGPSWDAAEALSRIRAQPDRSIGEALLDQRNLAGIGTMFRAETLFLERVHPRTPVAQVPDLLAIVDRARVLLENSVAGRTTTGQRAPGLQYWVFGRERRACRRCGTAIRVEEFGPDLQERRSHWCPSCQPEPDRAGPDQADSDQAGPDRAGPDPT